MTKHVSIFEAKNDLSALIQEVEETGQPIVLTRHGKAAAQLAPMVDVADRERRIAILEELRANREARVRSGAEKPAQMSWEALKAEMDEER
jgi:prevent-host-death family protein